MAPDANTAIPDIRGAEQATGDYRDMLVRLLTRQLYAETATAEVFGRSIQVAPTWRDKYLAAEFAFEEATHSQMVADLLEDLGQDSEAILAERPDMMSFWGIDVDNWVHIACFNFTVDRAGSHQIMEYEKSSYVPWAEKMVEVLADEEGHYDNGVESLRQFANDEENFGEFQRVFNDLLPNTIKAAFGRPLGPDNDFCLAHGLKRNTSEEVLNRYLTEMKGYMVETALKFPTVAHLEAKGAILPDSSKDIINSLQ